MHDYRFLNLQGGGGGGGGGGGQLLDLDWMAHVFMTTVKPLI